MADRKDTFRRSAPRDMQVKRIRWQQGFSERRARLIAELHYRGGRDE